MILADTTFYTAPSQCLAFKAIIIEILRSKRYYKATIYIKFYLIGIMP